MFMHSKILFQFKAKQDILQTKRNIKEGMKTNFCKNKQRVRFFYGKLRNETTIWENISEKKYILLRFSSHKKTWKTSSKIQRTKARASYSDMYLSNKEWRGFCLAKLQAHNSSCTILNYVVTKRSFNRERMSAQIRENINFTLKFLFHFFLQRKVIASTTSFKIIFLFEVHCKPIYSVAEHFCENILLRGSETL